MTFRKKKEITNAAFSYINDIREENKKDAITKLSYSDLKYAFIAGVKWATIHPETLSNLTIEDLAKLIIEKTK